MMNKTKIRWAKCKEQHSKNANIDQDIQQLLLIVVLVFILMFILAFFRNWYHVVHCGIQLMPNVNAISQNLARRFIVDFHVLLDQAECKLRHKDTLSIASHTCLFDDFVIRG